MREGEGVLNVSATTEPLDPNSPMNHLSGGECLRGIQLENLDIVSNSFHDLTPDVLPGPAWEAGVLPLNYSRSAKAEGITARCLWQYST